MMPFESKSPEENAVVSYSFSCLENKILISAKYCCRDRRNDWVGGETMLNFY